MSENEKRIIGIDLGTSTTLISRYYESEGTKLLPLFSNNDFENGIEDTVFKLSKPINQKDNKVILTGRNAWNARKHDNNPKRTYYNFKPKLLIDNNAREKILLWLKYINDVIRKAHFNATEKITDSYEIVIGVPAKWGKEHKEEYTKLAKKAGFEHIHLVPEPVAAILYAKSKKDNEKKKDTSEIKESYQLLFDFGGGTLDISLLKITEIGNYEIIYCGGESELGGKDFDKILTNHFVSKLKNMGISIEKQDEIDIETSVINAKSQLNKTVETEIYLKGETQKITQYDFINICTLLIGKIRTTINGFFKEMDSNKILIRKEQIDGVIKIGGAAKMFFINDLLHEIIGNHISINKKIHIIDSQKAVALGLPLYLTERETILNDIEPKIKEKFDQTLEDYNDYCNQILSKDQIKRDFESRYQVLEDMLTPENGNFLKPKNIEKTLTILHRKLLNDAINYCSEERKNKLKDIDRKINLLQNDYQKYIRIHFGIIPKEKPQIVRDAFNIKPPIFDPNVIFSNWLHDLFFKKETKMKFQFRRFYVKYFSDIEPNQKFTDWKKDGGFFYQMESKISLQIWEKFWEEFKKEFNI